jgi:hypothetical protein
VHYAKPVLLAVFALNRNFTRGWHPGDLGYFRQWTNTTVDLCSRELYLVANKLYIYVICMLIYKFERRNGIAKIMEK